MPIPRHTSEAILDRQAPANPWANHELCEWVQVRLAREPSQQSRAQTANPQNCELIEVTLFWECYVSSKS